MRLLAFVSCFVAENACAKDHGRLTPSEVTVPIGISRNSPEETAHCKGVLTNGFRVDYISSPGFRGTDQFQIQFTYGRHVDIDNYTVNVL